MYKVAPPLPLVRFETNLEERTAKTITGEPLRSIPNRLYGNSDKAEKIHDPIQSRKLVKWFVARSQQEVAYRQIENYRKVFNANDVLPEDKDYQKLELFDYVTYESYLYVETFEEREARSQALRTETDLLLNKARATVYALGIADVTEEDNKSIDSFRSNKSSESSNFSRTVSNGAKSANFSPSALYYSPSLEFDAEFESGNLEKAVRVIGRENLLTERHLQSLGDYSAPAEVDQEYDLTIRNDINTDGNIQWYYFAAKFDADQQCNFPLTVRFNIINMQKKDSLYNYGMKPAVFVDDGGEGDWGHDGNDVCYYRNGLTNCKVASSGRKKKSIIRQQYSLSFSYTFSKCCTVCFAHAFPYTYSDLQRLICSLESNNHLHRRALCETIAGNTCDVLTITERCDNMVESRNKPAIILSARIHPGESISSYMMQGCIEYLLSDCVEAKRLRKAFIFVVVPMLNPDGVIHGNYRCSLAGCDLNRRYKESNPSLFPTISAFKDLFQATQSRRPILMFLDLHGHSKVKNAFVYGCDLTYQTDKIVKHLTQNMQEEDINNRRLYARLYPRVLCTVSKANYNGYFSYNDCAFAIQKNKGGTGRLFGYRECGIIGSYTIESSFCGNGDNAEKKILKKMDNSLAASQRNNLIASGSGVNAVHLLASGGSGMNSGSESARSNDDNNDTNLPSAGASADYISDDNEEQEEEEEDEIDLVDETPPIIEELTKSKPSVAPLTLKALLERDPALNRLITSYKTQVHYSKQDLLNMGKHIVYAIYHYANLTHADLEDEVEQLLAKEKEEKDKNKVYLADQLEFESKFLSASIMKKERRQSTLSNSVTSTMINSNGGQSKERRESYYYDPIVRSGSNPFSTSTDSLSTPQSGKMQLLEMNLESSSLGESDGEDDEEALNGENNPWNSSGKAIDNEGDRIGSNVQLSASSKSVSMIKSTGSSDYLQDILQQHLKSPLVVFEESNVAHKSLTRPGVLSATTLGQLIQQYSSEFAVLEKSTVNIGMRVKCELILRRLLRLDDSRLKLDQKIISSFDAYNVAEVDDRSVSGSESNPSVDNNPTISNRLLSKTGNLISALRRVNLQKKSLQDVGNSKYQMKLMKKLYNQRQKQMKAKAEHAENPQPKPTPAPKRRPSTAPRNTQPRMTVQKREPLYRYANDNNANIVKVIPVTFQMMSNKELDRSRLAELQQQQQQQLLLLPSQQLFNTQNRYSIINSNRQSINLTSNISNNTNACLTSNSPSANSDGNSNSSGTGGIISPRKVSTSPSPITIISSNIPEHQIHTSKPTILTSKDSDVNMDPTPAPPLSNPTVGVSLFASTGSSKSNKTKRLSFSEGTNLPPASPQPSPSASYVSHNIPSLSLVAPVLSHNVLQANPTTSALNATPTRPSTPKMYYHPISNPTPQTPLVSPLRTPTSGMWSRSSFRGGETRTSLPDILPLLTSPNKSNGDSTFFISHSNKVRKNSGYSVKELNAELMISPANNTLLSPAPSGRNGQEKTSFSRALRQNQLFSSPYSAGK